MPPAASALAVGRTVAYLRKKCVRVARDDDDAQMSERARCDRRTEGWRMRWAGRRLSRRSALAGEGGPRRHRARSVYTVRNFDPRYQVKEDQQLVAPLLGLVNCPSE